jgi:hypothetical protein
MKKVINLLLLVVITFLCAVSSDAQGELPEDTAEEWIRIIAMAPKGENIVKKAATRAEKLRREIAAKRVEDKRRVAALLNILYPDELVTGLDDYFFGASGEFPMNDLFSEPKRRERFLYREKFVSSQRKSYFLQEALVSAIDTTLLLQTLDAETREIGD